MPPPSGRRSLLSRAADRLPAIDSTILLVAILAALATGAGGILVAASNPSATAAPTASPGAIGANSTPGAEGSQPPSPTADIGPTAPAITDGPTPTPARTATPEPTATPVPEPTSEPPAALTGYVWPVASARMSSRFGPRPGGFVLVDGKPAHDGLDLATWCGDRIRAAHAGTVLYAGRKFDPFLGYSQPLDNFYDHIGNLDALPIVVVIDDGNGYRSVYVHLSVSKVEAGDVVEAGQTIGVEGATGRATGCHLHYGLIRMDGPWQDVAPEHLGLYPPLVRPRIDPLLVFPLRDPDAPPRLREKYGTPGQPGLPFDPPPAGAVGG